MKYTDKDTGDELTLKEYINWRIQAWIRTPWFILAFNVITLVMFLFGWKDQWNWFASWLAVMIEWSVGTIFIAQAKRDAVYIRKIYRDDERIIKDVEVK